MLNRVEGAREGPQLAPPGAPERGGCPGDRAFGAVGMEIKAAPAAVGPVGAAWDVARVTGHIVTWCEGGRLARLGDLRGWGGVGIEGVAPE